MSPPAVNAGRRYSDAPSPDESLPFENRPSTPSNFSFYSKRALATSDILRSVRTRPTEQAALSRVADASRPISLRLAPASGLRKLHYGVWQGSTGGNGPSAPAAPAFVADSTKGGFGLKAVAHHDRSRSTAPPTCAQDSSGGASRPSTPPDRTSDTRRSPVRSGSSRDF